MKSIILVMIALFLVSCADSSQTGLKKDTTIKNVFNIAECGNVTISPSTGYEALSGNTEQETEAVAEATPDFTITATP